MNLLTGKEKSCHADVISMESGEGVKHVETLHVNDASVNAKLGPGKNRKKVMKTKGVTEIAKVNLTRNKVSPKFFM